MILLEPPFGVTDGLTLLRDHAVPGLVHVLPRRPELVVKGGRPALSLVQYLGGAGQDVLAGAVLTLETALAVSEADLAAAEAAAVRLFPGVRGQVRAVPAGLDAGTVQLVVLGAESEVPAPPAALGNLAAVHDPAAGPFRITFAGSGRAGPDGGAAFQLMLDAAAAELVGRCLDEPDLPVLVVQTMAFTGLRRAFEVEVHADWSAVHRALERRLGANLWYVGADAEKAVRSSLEECGVEVSTTVLGTGAEDRSAAERTRGKLVDWVLDRMFTARPSPDATAASVGQVLEQTIDSLTRVLRPGVSYRLRVLDETHRRALDARARETVAERREETFQGTLGGALRPLRELPDGSQAPGWPAVREGMLTRLDLSGFPRLDISVGVEDRFAADGVRRVRVTLGRPGTGGVRTDQRTLAFGPGGARQPYSVNLLAAGLAPALDRPYEYRTEVEFDSASALGAHPPAVADWRAGTATDLVVDPRDAYAMGEVRVALTPLFPFVAFPALTVQLRPAPTAALPEPPAVRVRLDETRTEDVWRFRGGGADPAVHPPYEYQVTYHRPPGGGGDVTGPWTPGDGPWLDVPDPMPEKIELQVFADLPWDVVQVAFLQLRYADPEHGIRYPPATLPLNRDTSFSTHVVPIAAGGSRAIDYRLTVKLAGGPLLDGSWRTTTDDRLIVDRSLVDLVSVAVRVVAGPLADRGLREARVALQRRGPDGRVLAAAERSVLPGHEADPVEPFEFLAGEVSDRSVHARGTFVDRTGFVTGTPWRHCTGGLVVLDLRGRAVTG